MKKISKKKAKTKALGKGLTSSIEPDDIDFKDEIPIIEHEIDDDPTVNAKVYFSIEKVNQNISRLVKLRISPYSVETEIIREDMPIIIRGLFARELRSQAFSGV